MSIVKELEYNLVLVSWTQFDMEPKPFGGVFSTLVSMVYIRPPILQVKMHVYCETCTSVLINPQSISLLIGKLAVL